MHWRLARDESGSVLPFVVVIMIVMIGMAALALDTGNWYVTKREAQAAADAGALAGAQDLPLDMSQAETDALSYVSKNISGASATATPYNGSQSQIKVVVTKTVANGFGSIFGIGSTTVQATAVATASGSGPTPYSIFAKDTNCGDQGLTLNGNSMTITGGTHSNGTIFANDNNGSYGTTTYGGPNGCSVTINGNGDTFGGSGSPKRDPNDEPWPADYSQNPPACTYSASSWTFQTNGQALAPGVYCATGVITLNANNLSGNVTFIANQFNLNSNNLALTPYANNLLIYQTGSNTLTIGTNAFLNGGVIFAPNAPIVWNSNNGTASGFIEGYTVTVTGNSMTFTGTGPIMTGGAGTLTQ